MDVVEVGAEVEDDAEMGQGQDGAEGPPASAQPALEAAGPSVRPIQMGEFLRKWVGRRLLLLHGGDIGRVMTAMRQLGAGTPGGAEALALFQQLVFDLWQKGGLASK